MNDNLPSEEGLSRVEDSQDYSTQEQSRSDASLDMEIKVVQAIRQAITTQILMFEKATEELDLLGQRMDRLTETSKLCRERLQEQQDPQGG